MLNFYRLGRVTKSLLAALSLAWGGIAMALPSCVTNYRVSNATLTQNADGGTLNGTWTVDWTRSPPALTGANLVVTGGSYAGRYAVPGTINTALQVISSASPGTFYGANFDGPTSASNMWLMFDVDTGVLQWRNGPGYFSIGNNASRTSFNAAGDVGTATASQCAAAAPIPTLSEWAMIFLASLMAMFAIRLMRRH